MRYFVTDQDGNIVRCGECQSEVANDIAGPGETFHVGDADCISQYFDIDTEMVCDYSESEIQSRHAYRPGFRWSRGQWVDERSLDQAKQQKWSEIKRARTAEEFGTFLVGGYEFDCDKDSQTRINSAFQSAMDARTNGEPFSIDWTLADDTNVTLARAQVIAVGRALQEHVNAVYDKSRQLRDQIASAVSIQELDGISW
jgi:hypothetical protein